ERHDLGAPQLVERAIRHQYAGDIANMLANHQIVLRQRGTRLDQVDDHVAQTDQRRELDRAAHVDDLYLHALLGEMLRGNTRELCRDAWHARGLRGPRGCGHDHPTLPNPELDRLIQIVRALQEHIPAADTQIGDAIFDVG